MSPDKKEVVTEKDVRDRFGAYGNLDIDPKEAEEKIRKERDEDRKRGR